MARKLSALRAFARFLKREGWIDDDPAALAVSPRREHKIPAHLSVGEMSRLLDMPDTAEPLGRRDRATPVGERPAAVAADWYAARHGVARARVKSLQQDRLSAREVRVLVMADGGRGRLRTALVRVRLGPDGWRVR